MTTAMRSTVEKTTVDLPPCGRRWWMRGPDGERFVCKPGRNPKPDLPFAELLKRPCYLKPREVSAADCLACTDREPPMGVEELARFVSVEALPEVVDEAPAVLPDGTIVFRRPPGSTAPPPVPAGYRRRSSDITSDDAWILVPDFDPCRYFRLIETRAEDCDCIRLQPRCVRDSGSELAKDTCAACPHREQVAPGAAIVVPRDNASSAAPRPVRFEADGTIVYDRRPEDWEPPRNINGYQRDPNDSFRFIRLWPPCPSRKEDVVRYPACGCINILARCGNPHGDHFGKQITHTDCLGCVNCGSTSISATRRTSAR